MKNQPANRRIRCFIAINLPSDVREQISKYIENLKVYSKDIRWINAANLHLTLKFLSEITSDKVHQVKKCLYPISDQFSSFNLNIFGTGCFPGKKRPRVFWIGMEQDKTNPLFVIQQWIENQLLDLKFEKEKRRFSPHLTLGRVRAKTPVDFSELFTFLEQNPFEPFKFSVTSIFFMQSILKPSGAEYHIIEKYPLKK